MLEEDRKETVKQIEKAVKDEQERAKVSVIVILAFETKHHWRNNELWMFLSFLLNSLFRSKC